MAMSLKERVFLKSDGRMTLPKTIREKLKLTYGCALEVEVYSDNKILITVLAK